ncbi:MAG TPA: 4'-phosphopantetheinyl transferase superfamily protein [Polyangia bacterium]|nr:4'-phosphopantetheinyl transferase superfamily protein [Polyangia bacterium]
MDIWVADPSILESEALAAAYDALLTDEERAKVRSYRFERNRREALLARVLVRTALSRYRPVTPAAWRFTRNDFGRPAIDPPCGLFFNVSHRPTLAVCAVSPGLEVGVDVEPISNATAILEVAPRVFAPDEYASLLAVDADDRRRRAVTLWTLKESYIKARGQGLALPLDAFSFDVRDAGGWQVAFRPPIEDSPERWWFRTFDVGEHQIALTVERASGLAPTVRLRRCVPLGT